MEYSSSIPYVGSTDYRMIETEDSLTSAIPDPQDHISLDE